MNNEHEIRITMIIDHYEIYIDSQFYASCDTMSEVEQEIKSYEENKPR